jgi:hypothetical protein
VSQKVASAALVEALDGSGLYTEQRNLELFQQVPPELRLTEFSPRTLPDHPAFRWRLGCRPEWRGFDLGPLPEAMQRDFAYCLWRVVDSGLTINPPYWQLVSWFIHLAEDVRAAGRPPLRSLIDRSIAEWEHELIKERARRLGKMGWPKFGTGVFRRSYRHLVIAYDPREWWQHDAWSPRFDARIPLRDHEPGAARAGFDFTVIEQPWLRAALKWQLKTALDCNGRLRCDRTARARAGKWEGRHARSCSSLCHRSSGIDAACAQTIRTETHDLPGAACGFEPLSTCVTRQMAAKATPYTTLTSTLGRS